MVIHTANQVHRQKSERRRKKLLLHIIKRVAEANFPIVGACAVQSDKPERYEEQHQYH